MRVGDLKHYRKMLHSDVSALHAIVAASLFLLAIFGIDMVFFSNSDVGITIPLACFVLTIMLVLAAMQWRQQQIANKNLKKSRERTLQQEEALSTVINSATQAILTVSASGKVMLYNSALLGLIDTNQSLSDAVVDSILPLVDSGDTSVSLFNLMKKLRHFERDDLMMKIDNNDRMRLRINVNNIQSSYGMDRPDEYVCTLRDITKEKSLEEERDEFISVVSHELRTPLTIAEGSIDNALVMVERIDSAQTTIKESIALAHEQVRFLASMINDLSTLSRAERGVADETEKIDVTELAHKLFAEYEPQARQKGLQLNLNIGAKPGTITTTRLYLEELLQNFITNAIKYTKQGTVDIAIKRTGNAVVFSVKDSGIGISKSDQSKIFNKFYRSEDYRTRETGGTGLGLYVAAKLARKLQTRIDVRSRLNHGSTFSIELKAD